MFGLQTGGFGSASEATSYFDGVIAGLDLYAHMRDGTSFVGTTGTTLAEARDQVEAHRREVMSRDGAVVSQIHQAKDDHTIDHDAERPGGLNADFEPLGDGVTLRAMAETVARGEGEQYPPAYNTKVAELLLTQFAPTIGDRPDKPMTDTEDKAKRKAEAANEPAANQVTDDGENTPIRPGDAKRKDNPPPSNPPQQNQGRRGR